MNKVYQVITDRIIEALKGGAIPWHKEWNAPGSRPQNLITKHNYSGINMITTAFAGYTSNYWLTYKQAQANGGQVKRGEKGTPIIFWKMMEDKYEPDKMFPLLRYFTVFNTEQIEGLPEDLFPENIKSPPVVDTEIDNICRGFLLSYTDRPKITTGGDRAFYKVMTDSIKIPKRKYFKTVEGYWSVLFHELIHSTGAESRLHRAGVTKNFHDGKTYSFEELVAEIGSAFLCAESGISNAEIERNQESYIQGWITALQNEPKWIVEASGKASSAVKYIKKEVA